MGVYSKKISQEWMFLLNQAGWAGIVQDMPGFDFSKMKNKNPVRFHSVITREKTSE
jgi:hypothetical protein